MSLHDRAAQFAPFAALNGHAASIEQTMRNHIDSVNEQHFEDDPLLLVLSEHNTEDYD